MVRASSRRLEAYKFSKVALLKEVVFRKSSQHSRFVIDLLQLGPQTSKMMQRSALEQVTAGPS